MLAPLAARLLGIAEADLVFRKGAVWWLRARLVEGCVQASLVASLSPELVTGA
jgi:hypothetical protein